MACNTCVEKIVALATNIYGVDSDCEEESGNCGTKAYAECLFYRGANLSCSGIEKDDSLEEAIQKIDTKLCTVLGDYATFNMACLTDSIVITTEKQFVETISSEFCVLKSNFESFLTNAFPTYQTSVTNQFLAITSPNITCASAGITAADSLNTVYGKYCNKFTSIDNALSLTGVEWGQCFSVPTPPTTIKEGFDLLIDQICTVKASAGVANLPEFNNVGTCLPGTLTATDSLVDTVNKIKERLCTTPSLNINNLSWGCMTKPNDTATNLQDTLQVLLNKVTSLAQNLPTFSGDFSVNPVDAGSPCAGKIVSLSSSPYVDKFVGATAGDTTPGTLQEKLEAGIGITLDYNITPGKVRVSSSNAGNTDEKTKASASGTAGALDQKMTGANSGLGIAIDTPYDAGIDRIKVTPVVDLALLMDKLLDVIAATPTLKEKFCALVKSCPSPCSAPANVVVTMEP